MSEKYDVFFFCRLQIIINYLWDKIYNSRYKKDCIITIALTIYWLVSIIDKLLGLVSEKKRVSKEENQW